MATVLVALDGSEFAEQVLPFAEALAEGGAKLILVQAVLAVMPAQGAQPAERQQRVLVADEYLRRLERYFTGKGLAVERRVRYGSAPYQLIDAASELQADLIVMASHGRSGLERWVLGSVADRVVRSALCPVLVVRAVAPPLWTGDIPELSRVVIPLDGSPLAEAALLALSGWYGKLVREVGLVRVVDIDTEAIEAHDVVSLTEQAQAYLDVVARRLSARGLTVHTEVRAGDAGAEIAAYAAERRADYVLLSSHGRSGVSRWLLGSVAQRVVEHSPLPVLVVRQILDRQYAGERQPAVDTGARCFNCGRPYYGDLNDIAADARCLRCDYHLHACGNCVFHDTVRCTLDRSDANETIAGARCPKFSFRQAEPARPENRA